MAETYLDRIKREHPDDWISVLEDECRELRARAERAEKELDEAKDNYQTALEAWNEDVDNLRNANARATAHKDAAHKFREERDAAKEELRVACCDLESMARTNNNALIAAKAEAARLRAALEWYANADGELLDNDEGEFARKALGGTDGS